MTYLNELHGTDRIPMAIKPVPPVPGASDRQVAPRTVRSYVLREGRITPAQRRAFATYWERFGLDFVGRPRDLDKVFGRSAPHVMEIGFGNGDALAWASAHDPDRDYLGVEVHRPGVGRLMNTLAAAGTSNVRIYCHDAVEVLREEIMPESLHEVRIWFPDPWPKKRHHKRRLVQLPFVELLASRMVPGGVVHLATDWMEYAEHMHLVMAQCQRWRNCSATGDFVPRPPWRIQTRFEKRGRTLGHGVRDMLYTRI